MKVSLLPASEQRLTRTQLTQFLSSPDISVDLLHHQCRGLKPWPSMAVMCNGKFILQPPLP